MIDLRPIVDDLKSDKLARGDKVVLVQNLLLGEGYKLLEMHEYMRGFDWDEWEDC